MRNLNRLKIFLPVTFLLSCPFALAIDSTTLQSPTASSPGSPSQKPKSEEITAALREKLSPVIEMALQDHCGEDCPSFRIDTQFKKPSHGILDDLGFSKPATSDPNSELQSITISVLVQDKVSQGARESLRQILSHRASNEAPVPVHIQLKPLNSLSPYLEKQSQAKPSFRERNSSSLRQKWVIVRTLIWPVSLLLITFLGFIALLFFLKNRRDLLRDRLAAFRETQASPSPQGGENLVTTPAVATNFLVTRPDDLFWLIEDLASREDYKSLKKVISTYQPQELTSQFKFSNQALRVLASLPAQRLASDDKLSAEECIPWLKDALDEVHWKRVAEQSLPLTKLARLTDTQCTEIFSRLKSVGEKSVFIGAIPENRWPNLLSPLSSEERIQIGLALSEYQNSGSEERKKVEASLSADLERILRTPNATQSGTIENFTLYLSDQEGQNLWKILSQQSLIRNSHRKPPTLSIDALVQGLDPSATLEIFTGLDISALRTLLNHLSTDAKQKVLASIPKGLRERVISTSSVGGQSSENEEAQLMRARAQLLDAYRKFGSGNYENSRSVIQ